MRLGIFGGSFDPVHNGHLALARACQRQAALDEVWFTPTAVQPLKHEGPHATDAQRVEMLELAIDTDPSEPSEPGRPRPRFSWRICTLEIDRGGLSYTIDTLRQLHAELPDADLFFLIGSDTLRDVARWKEPRQIFRLATPLVVHRAGEPAPDLALLASFCTPDTQPRRIEMPACDISSTEIRRRLASGGKLDDLVPRAVANFIATNSIYARSKGHR
jgi:nicotinate-nucleotide adenylyltransferase